MTRTRIEWATDTWNPITGCSHAGSPGCDHCYARPMAKRLAGRFGYPESPHEFDVTFHPDKLEEPLRWRKPRVVFVCSMSDWLHPNIPVEWQARMFGVMADRRCERHTFLLLTKRPENYGALSKYLCDEWQALKNLWHGVTVETQDQMWRVEELVKIPGKHWVNFGPLLGPVTIPPELLARLAGVAVEGESGPGARPMHPDWARSIRDQCAEVGVPFTFKQWGTYMPYVDAAWGERDPIGAFRGKCISVREAPVYGSVSEIMVRVGKKAAGRELDGQLWDQFPWRLLA